MTTVGRARRAERRPALRRRDVVIGLVGLFGIAVLCSLGAWQVERLAWKNALVAQIHERQRWPSVPVEELASGNIEGSQLDYRSVSASGVFHHEDERAFLSTFRGAAGWNIYTPLELADGRFVFVNRGFVPYDRKDPATRAAGQIVGTTDVVGVARPFATEKPGSFVPDNDPRTNVYFWRHLPDLLVGLDLGDSARFIPFVIDAGPGAAPGGYPVGGTTIVEIPNNHLQYAITWFGLAAVLAGMLVAAVFRRPRSSDTSTA
ncbi:SURF1 family protein [Aureimonas jatrophae]|uniref:SURF1 family protein n=1 Tax=Aureimonas jatrophae TaxID=1166073 RepID=UPI00181E1C94|nr:SURF1 family protein [Aureimonas jatrophae]MBB3949674.1 surfeit locus 1 family protein [Aureimonas jatrophae]